jgi:hypothetical protein
MKAMLRNGLLRVRCQRPGQRTTQKRDKIAPSHCSPPRQPSPITARKCDQRNGVTWLVCTATTRSAYVSDGVNLGPSMESTPRGALHDAVG